MNDNHDQISDERLFIRYTEGDGEMFRIIMDRYAVRLLHYCRGFVESQEEAEDLVQEAFLRAIRSAPTYRATSRFSTWIYTIARNLALDRVKSNRNRATLRESRQDEIAESTTGTAPEAPDSIVPGTFREMMKAALAVLTPLEVETIRLTFQAEWTTAQIADLQQCSRTTVRTRRYQALKKIRQVMTGQNLIWSIREG